MPRTRRTAFEARGEKTARVWDCPHVGVLASRSGAAKFSALNGCGTPFHTFLTTMGAAKTDLGVETCRRTWTRLPATRTVNRRPPISEPTSLSANTSWAFLILIGLLLLVTTSQGAPALERRQLVNPTAEPATLAWFPVNVQKPGATNPNRPPTQVLASSFGADTALDATRAIQAGINECFKRTTVLNKGRCELYLTARHKCESKDSFACLYFR